MKRKILLLVLSMLLLVSGAISFILLSETGLNWAVAYGTKNIPGEISFESLQGRLLDHIAIQEVRYQTRELSVTVKSVNSTWSFVDLLLGKIHITSLESDKFEISLIEPISHQQKSPTSISNHKLMPIIIDSGLLRNISINIKHKQQQFAVSELSFQSITIDKFFQFKELFIKTDSFELSAQGNILFDADFSIDIQTQWKLNTPGFAKLSGEGSVTGSLSRIELSQIVTEPVMVNVHGLIKGPKAKNNMTDPVQISATWQNLTWPLDNNITLTSSSGRLEIVGDFEKYELTLDSVIGEIDDVKGILREHPIKANGQIEISPNAINLSELNIQSNENTFFMSGTLAEKLDIKWTLDAPDIATLIPFTAGTVRSKGSVTGPKDTPVISLTLNANDLDVQEHHIRNIEVNMDLDLQNINSSSLTINAEGINDQTLSIDKLIVHADGKAFDHRLNTSIELAGANITLKANGSVQKDAWLLNLTTADFASANIGNWSLEDAVPIQITRNGIQSDQVCINAQLSKLCAQGLWQISDPWQITIRGTELPFTLAKPLMPTNFTLDGGFNIQIDAGSVEDNLIIGSLQLQSHQGSITQELGFKNQITNDYVDAVIELELDTERLSTNIKLTMADGSTLDGAAILPRAVIDTNFDDSKQNNIPIQGHLNARINKLDWLTSFTTELDNTKGTANVALKLSGTISDPQLKGSISLTDGSTEIPRAGLSIDNIELQISTKKDNTYSINAQMASGSGELFIKGTMDWIPDKHFDTGLNIRLTITGHDFEIIKIPEAWVMISPELEVHILDYNIDLTGALHIPKANLEIRDLTATILPSQDVIIEIQEEIATQQRRYRINSLIKLSLGEQVQFKGFGLSGQLSGDIALIDSPQKITTGFGELRINNGEYQVQTPTLDIIKDFKTENNLDIEKGRLIFVGGAVDDPGLDIHAVRQIQDILVGFNARGTLKAPQLSIFSESDPPIDDSDALSYLLLGRPVAQATQLEGEGLLNAVKTLGLTGGEIIARKFGKAFGIDDVAIESGDDFSSTSLVVGKYLSPRLYVRYGIGLIEPVNIFRLRYQLGSKWYLQSESGLESGADLIYTLEK